MIRFRVRLAVIAGAIGVCAGVRAAPRQIESTHLLAEAREALGGDAHLATIRSFVIKGRIRQGERPAAVGRAGRGTRNTRGAVRQTSGTFEIDCELPDRFVRIENRVTYNTGGAIGGGRRGVSSLSASPAIQHVTETIGFDGDRILSSAPGALSQAAARAPFANLTLGIFATSFAGLPLQFSDAPDHAVSVAAAIPGVDFGGTLMFDPKTHLPSSLNDLLYEDYRNIDGVNVPFLLAADSEDLELTDVLFNVSIKPSVFEPAGGGSR